MTLIALAPHVAHAQTRASSFTLANGMDVVVVPDTRAPVVTHMVWYRVGAADEPPGASGIAHFLEHLMFKGTKTVPPGEFSKIIARNGGQDNAFTSQDVTAYFQRIAKDRLEMVMKMEADRMANLRLAEDDVTTERKVILEERKSRVDNDPAAILDEQMGAALYMSHPYRIPIIGWAHEIEKLDREDALTFYDRFYAPNNAILVVTGDVTPEEVKRLAEATYGQVAARPEVGARPRPMEPEPAAPRRITYEDPRAGKPTFERNYLVPSAVTTTGNTAEALDLVMRIIGGGATSRLYRRLVIDERIAANASAWYLGTARDYGRMGFYAVAHRADDLPRIEAIIDEVIADVQANGVTERELNRVRTDALADFIYGSDNQATLARRYGFALTTGQTIAHIEGWPDRVRALTLADLQKAAQDHLVLRRSVTGILLPKQTEQAADAGAGARQAQPAEPAVQR